MEELLSELQREEDSHKGENGRVGVIAGSRDYAGAPALSAEASLRTGCDLAKILTSETIRPTVAGYSENLIVDSYEDEFFSESSVSKAEELVKWSDCCVIGPGMGDIDEEAVKKLVSTSYSPMVIDAEAIDSSLEADLTDVILTPHEGEAQRIKEKFGSIEDFVDETGAIVVVKGSTDLIYTSSEVYENDTGTAAMTVGGTGDVLAGVIASLVSQGLNLEDSARLGAWLNGIAGEAATEEYGNGMLATDLIQKIPHTLRF